MEKERKFLQKSKTLTPEKLYNITIPIKILKENSDICSYTLHHNFNISLFSNKLPKYLKKASITPVFKQDEEFLKTNYRPVSILSTVSTMFIRSNK